MSIYDQIAQGIPNATRGLPQLAALFEGRRRTTEAANAHREEVNYRRGRDAQADYDEAEKLKLEHTREQLGMAFFVAAKDKDYTRGKELMQEAGLDPRIVDEVGEAEARRMYAQLGEKFSGIKADDQSLGTLYGVMENGKEILRPATEAVGKEKFRDPDAGAQGSWSNPWKGVDPKTGKRGLWQTHSLSGTNRPAKVGPDQIQPDEDAGGEGGGVGIDNAIYRQSAAYFSDVVDPVTGEIKVLTADAPKVQALARRATELQRGGQSIAAAVEQASKEQPWKPKAAPRQPRPAATPAASPAAQAPVQEGTRARNPTTGVVIEMRGGQWVQVGGPGG